MSIIMLTSRERERFAEWLRQDVESNREMIKQMEKLPHAKPVIDYKTAQIAACEVVASMLENTEDMSIHG